MTALFYKTSRHGNCGSNVVFNNIDGCGYGTNLKKLETYTLEEAQKEQDYNDGSLLLSKEEVDKLAVKRVDHQVLNKDKGSPINPEDLCVIQNDGVYDGNDIQFVTEFSTSFNLAEAKIVSFEYALNHVHDNQTIWLKSHLEAISRDTFQSVNINKKRMMTKYGLRYRTPRVRHTTGKTRGNCPTCGKLTWSYNPYENEYCNSKCKENYLF